MIKSISTLILCLWASCAWAWPGGFLQVATGGGAVSDCTAVPQSEESTFSSYIAVGNGTVNYVSSMFVATSNFTLCAADIYVTKVGSPTGSANFAIYTDNAGNPGTIVGNWSDNTDVSTFAAAYKKILGTSAPLTNGTPYHLVVRYTGGDASNYARVGQSSTGVTNSIKLSADAITWTFSSATRTFMYKLYN